MAECTWTGRCGFYRDELATMPMISEIYKDYYCRGDNSECAICMLVVAIGEQQLPVDLFPNQIVRARKLIAQARTMMPSPAPLTGGRNPWP